MLNKEFGFSLVLSEIFGLKNAAEEDLERSKYLNENLNNLSVTEEGYKAIKDYVDNSCNNIGFEIINGILATFAYGHPILVSGIDESIKQVILREKDVLFCELDNSFPDLKTHLNKQQYQVCQSLIKMKISHGLVDCLANHRYFSPEMIIKKGDFYGLQKLLPAIAAICPKEFENWYLKTKRDDLKAVFVNSFLDFDFHKFSHNISKFSAEGFIESKIDVLRLYSILMEIGADRLGGGMNREKAKNLIPEKRIAEKEKLHLVLYSFKYSRFDQKDDVENKLLEEDIKIFANNFSYLDEEIVSEFLGCVDDLVLAKIIESIEDRERRTKLLSIIVSKLDSRLKENRRPHIQDILKANLHGSLLKEFGDEYGQEVEELFNQNLSKINEPYFYYRHNDLWSEAISTAMYYLIMVFVFYHSKDSSKISVCKNKFVTAKRNFYHYLSKEFDEILSQIK